MTALEGGQARFETLAQNLLQQTQPLAPSLSQALEYSLLSGGKRLRPGLVWEFCRAVGGSLESADRAALAVEAIHSYSLIHDDLPAMDDDDLRRGKPSNHKVFGEGVAILAGDALQTLAFQTLTDPDLRLTPLPDPAAAVTYLARAAGSQGMVDGQALDLLAENGGLDDEWIERIHSRKTGALIACACSLGVLAGEGGTQALRQAQTFGETLGLAFQVQDDCLDVTSTSAQLGKPAGSDEASNKATFVTILGIDAAHDLTRDLFNRAQHCLAEFPKPEVLLAMTQQIAARNA